MSSSLHKKLTFHFYPDTLYQSELATIIEQIR